MRIEKDVVKEAINKRKYKLIFSFAELILDDPLAVEIYDRFEGGEHRWHCLAEIETRLLLLVYTYPYPEDEDVVRVIGLREAPAHERQRYEQGGFE